MERTAVLILDVQNALIQKHPYHPKKFLERMGALVDAARANKIEVIYLQQTDKERPEGSEAWALAAPLSPLPEEKCFKKHFSSAFHESSLREYLDSRDIRTLILAGLETEYSVDATCKVAYEYGFSVIIPAQGTTTFDTCFAQAKRTIAFYEEAIWAGRYAAVLPFKDVLKQMAH
ncbi:MAG: isochorismatase family protein [Faecalibacterium sp.]